MVELSILDGTTVTTSQGSVTGPLLCYVESVTVSGVPVTVGHVQVLAGQATMPFGELTKGQADLWPFGAFFSFFVCAYVLVKIILP